jgi:hypothetical protein
MRFAAKTATLALAMTALPGIAAPAPSLAAPPALPAAPAPAAPAPPAAPALAAPAPAAPVLAAPAQAALKPAVTTTATTGTAATTTTPAAPTAAATITPAAPAAPGPVTVARYSFDGGAGATGRIAENSGRGSALTVRAANGGRVTFTGTTADKVASFPARCATTTTTCPRALLEGTDDADLDPGTRLFRWGASVRLTKAQVTGSSNVVQKGVVDTESQWKMQIGARQGKAQCAVVGQGSAQVYLIRSSVGVADDKWHDIMCQRSGSTLAVYVDGQARGRVTVPAALSIANARPLRIGGPNFNTKSDMYHGLLDDVYARLG